MARLIYGKIEFNEEQTKAINEMQKVWKKAGKKQLLEELFNYDDSNTKKADQLLLNAHRLRKKYIQ